MRREKWPLDLARFDDQLKVYPGMFTVCRLSLGYTDAFAGKNEAKSGIPNLRESRPWMD